MQWPTNFNQLQPRLVCRIHWLLTLANVPASLYSFAVLDQLLEPLLMKLFDSVAPVPAQARRSMLDAKGHICGLFQSEDEKYETLSALMREALEYGERAHHVINPLHRDEHLRRLEQAGIDVSGATGSGQLTIRTWPDVYFSDGAISHDRAFKTFSSFSDHSLASGHPRTQFFSNMEWALGSDHDALMEYEASYELFASESLSIRDVVVCCYDLNQWGGELIMQTLRTHPLVIVGGVLHENPFFTKPGDVLAELKAKRASRCGCHG